MRTPTAQQLVNLGSAARSTHARVLVLSDGSWVDLRDLNGFDWVRDISYGSNIDSPVAEMTVNLCRENEALSLAPLVEGSPLNNLTGSYEPLLDLGVQIKAETCVLLDGEQPTASSWVEVFTGYIDEIDWSSSKSVVQVKCRDKASLLVDTWIETVRNYGDTAGIAVETVIQEILDDNINTPGLGSVTLYSPNGTGGTPFNPADSPAFVISIYQQAAMSVWDAILALVQLFGWDIRYKWHAGTSAFQLVLFEVDRAATSVSRAFGPDSYYDLPRVAMSRQNIRNVVRVSYVDETTGRQAYVDASDSTSIARYGRRFMKIGEGSSSQISTAAEAGAMATAALSDLKDPVVNQEVSIAHDPFAELADLDSFASNGKHYDTTQTLAVSAITHQLTRDSARTVLSLRGKPSTGYLRWLKISAPVVEVGIGDGSIRPINYYADSGNSENLLPNGDFQTTDIGDVPPQNWAMVPKYPLPSGAYTDLDAIVAAGGKTWGSDVEMLDDVVLSGHESLAINGDGTNTTIPIFQVEPFPVDENGIYAVEFSHSSSIDYPAGGLNSVMHLAIYGLDQNKANPVHVEQFTYIPPLVAGAFAHKASFLRTTGVRYLLCVPHGYFHLADRSQTFYIGEIRIRKVNEAFSAEACTVGGTSQSIPATTSTQVEWNAIQRTPAGIWVDVGNVSDTDGSVNCIQSGPHDIRATVGLDSVAAGKTMSVYLKVNGSTVASKSITTVAGTNAVEVQLDGYELSVGDVTTVEVQHNDSVARTVTNDNQISYIAWRRRD